MIASKLAGEGAGDGEGEGETIGAGETFGGIMAGGTVEYEGEGGSTWDGVISGVSLCCSSCSWNESCVAALL